MLTLCLRATCYGHLNVRSTRFLYNRKLEADSDSKAGGALAYASGSYGAQDARERMFLALLFSAFLMQTFLSSF